MLNNDIKTMSAKLMKGISIEKYGGPKVLKVAEITIPSISQNEVLIRIKSAGINPVDTYIREGHFSNLPNLPYTPGKDGAGVVSAVGKDVTKFKIGDRVFICHKTTCQHGTYADYTVARQEDVFPLHESLNFHQGAALGVPYFTAFRALLWKDKVSNKETVLIHGASGAVGLAAVQIAKANGMTVIGTAGTPEGMELVKKNGADHILCHKEKRYLQKISEITEDRGVDIIIEMLANVNLANDLQFLAPNGRVMIVGCRGSIEIEPRDMMFPETKIIGVAVMSSTEDEWKDIAAATVKGIKDGWLKPVIDKIYKLDEASDAHHDIIHNSGSKGKLVIGIDDSA